MNENLLTDLKDWNDSSIQGVPPGYNLYSYPWWPAMVQPVVVAGPMLHWSLQIVHFTKTFGHTAHYVAAQRAGPVHLGALSRIILGPCFVVDRINFATENKQLYAFITLYFIFFVPLWTRFNLFYYLLSILTETVKVKLTHLPHFYFYFTVWMLWM